MKATRLFSHSDGTTHCEPVEIAEEQRAHLGDGVAFQVGPIGTREVTFTRTQVKSSAEDVHNAPRRQWVVFLRGQYAVETSLGNIFHFGPGDVLLAEDIAGNGHKFREIGDPDGGHLLLTFPVDG